MADVHPQIRALLAAQPPPALDAAPADLGALRAAYAETGRALGGAPVAVARVRDLLAERPGLPPVPVRAYHPTRPAAALGAIVWFHGGGWVIGDLDGFDHVARELCEASGQLVVSVDYRLAPEHPFPAPAQDAEDALRWAAGPGADLLGHDPARIVVGGDSAGGQLAALAALRAPGLARRQLLVYPALDPAMDSPAYRGIRAGPDARGVRDGALLGRVPRRRRPGTGERRRSRRPGFGAAGVDRDRRPRPAARRRPGARAGPAARRACRSRSRSSTR